MVWVWVAVSVIARTSVTTRVCVAVSSHCLIHGLIMSSSLPPLILIVCVRLQIGSATRLLALRLRRTTRRAAGGGPCACMCRASRRRFGPWCPLAVAHLRRASSASASVAATTTTPIIIFFLLYFFFASAIFLYSSSLAISSGDFTFD